MSKKSVIAGIDLGTTNSEIAVFVDGKVQVLGPQQARMLPSCVGLSPTGELLVGQAARNQQLVYPERTVRSIKRQMGSDTTVRLGDKSFTPPEISALILRALTEMAARQLGEPVRKAVITVPAYFSDAQRQATREAGVLAGLEVVRILNEPTAASLAYGHSETERHTALIYDLGGGTFDVSIVHVEGDVTEVLASHGNNQLGGDDFDQLLLGRLAGEFKDEHGVDLLQEHPAAHSRLWWAVEEAKQRLSSEPYATVREENLVTIDGQPLHLEREITRKEYEELIAPLVDSTLDSVAKALGDAGKSAAQLDTVLLVGGATRTPLVARILQQRTSLTPHGEVHPDLCVVLGAGVLASRLDGHDVERILVDVSPYSFGPSYLGERGGVPYPHCYHPVIQRNTPLPVTRSEAYSTASPYQTAVDIRIHQGDDPDALRNLLVGHFKVEGLTATEESNEVLCRMNLDLDGILRVTAIEKSTGKSKQITISEALRPSSKAEIVAARARLEALYDGQADDESFTDSEDVGGDVWTITGTEASQAAGGAAEAEAEGEADERQTENAAADTWVSRVDQARGLVNKSRGLLDKMHDEDKEDAIDLHESIEAAIDAEDGKALTQSGEALKELVFFVEGQ